ncbi:MAG: hypothetical protein RIK87_15825 [Fuerstiella sp.]
MAAPDQFVVTERFKHKSPETVRALAERYGFTRRTTQGTKDSETWVKPGASGFWVIRVDSQGHGRWYHGRRPHYHKNWVEAAKLNVYLSRYLPDAYVYSDDGTLIGQSQHSVHPESRSKAQHIPR